MCVCAAERETVKEFEEYIILNCDVDVLLILFAQLVFHLSANYEVCVCLSVSPFHFQPCPLASISVI